MKQMVRVSASSLKEIREEKGLSRQQLSDESKVDMSTISRIESAHDTNGKSNVRAGTVEKLARALGVTLEALQGQSQDILEREFVKFKISDMSRNALELVSRRYGMDRNSIVEFAPLLFCLMAEQSLQDRKKKLARIRDSLSELATQKSEFPEWPDINSIDQVVLECEENSIIDRDLFCNKLAEELNRRGLRPKGRVLGEDPISKLLALYINELVSSDPELLNTLKPIGDVEATEDGPIHYFCFDQALAEFDGDRGAAFAVIKGVVPLHQVPKGDAKERASWVKREFREMTGEDAEECLDDIMDAKLAAARKGELLWK